MRQDPDSTCVAEGSPDEPRSHPRAYRRAHGLHRRLIRSSCCSKGKGAALGRKASCNQALATPSCRNSRRQHQHRYRVASLAACTMLAPQACGSRSVSGTTPHRISGQNTRCCARPSFATDRGTSRSPPSLLRRYHACHHPCSERALQPSGDGLPAAVREAARRPDARRAAMRGPMLRAAASAAAAARAVEAPRGDCLGRPARGVAARRPDRQRRHRAR